MPFAKPRAIAGRQAGTVELELVVEPGAPRDECALGVLPLGCFSSVGEETGERRLELGLRPGLAFRRVVKVAVVEQPMQAAADQVGLIVQELAPFRALG